MTDTREAVIAYHNDEITDTIVIDFKSMPSHVLNDLAAATVESVKAFLRQPGGREFIDSKIAAKRAEKRLCSAN